MIAFYIIANIKLLYFGSINNWTIRDGCTLRLNIDRVGSVIYYSIFSNLEVVGNPGSSTRTELTGNERGVSGRSGSTNWISKPVHEIAARSLVYPGGPARACLSVLTVSVGRNGDSRILLLEGQDAGGGSRLLGDAVGASGDGGGGGGGL